jgi:hypothetical protein
LLERYRRRTVRLDEQVRGVVREQKPAADFRISFKGGFDEDAFTSRRISVTVSSITVCRPWSPGR